MALYYYDLNPEPFDLIRTGKKIYELRLYDERRRGLQPGDTIEFTNNITGEKLVVRVESLHIFKNFKDLFDYLPQEDFGYERYNAQAYLDMLAYYPLERQLKFPALAIKISLI